MARLVVRYTGCAQTVRRVLHELESKLDRRDQVQKLAAARGLAVVLIGRSRRLLHHETRDGFEVHRASTKGDELDRAFDHNENIEPVRRRRPPRTCVAAKLDLIHLGDPASANGVTPGGGSRLPLGGRHEATHLCRHAEGLV